MPPPGGIATIDDIRPRAEIDVLLDGDNLAAPFERGDVGFSCGRPRSDDSDDLPAPVGPSYSSASIAVVRYSPEPALISDRWYSAMRLRSSVSSQPLNGRLPSNV